MAVRHFYDVARDITGGYVATPFAGPYLHHHINH